jgi:hypothetical protein
MGRTRDVSKILTSNTSILSLASASSIYQTKASNALVLLNTTSFTTQTTVSINDVFSATYDNYKILFSGTGSTGENIRIRMRVSGSDDSSNVYVEQGIQATSTSMNSGRSTSTSFGSQYSTGFLSTTFSGGPNIELRNPFLVQQTTLYGQGVYDPHTNIRQMFAVASHQSATSYTGFTFFVATGTMTGSVSVYGYNK